MPIGLYIDPNVQVNIPHISRKYCDLRSSNYHDMIFMLMTGFLVFVPLRSVDTYTHIEHFIDTCYFSLLKFKNTDSE